MSKFVIFCPDHNDYLSALALQEGPGVGWHKELEKAHRFRTFEQAHHAAKQLANQMQNYDEPYRIQIYEVKEKNGRWKSTFRCDVPPDPIAERARWRQENPGQAGQVLSRSIPGPEINPPVFVIYQPAQDDYLSATATTSDVETTSWHPHPGSARRFKSRQEVESFALQLINSKGYALTICELHETNTQYWMEPILELFPVPVDPSLN